MPGQSGEECRDSRTVNRERKEQSTGVPLLKIRKAHEKGGNGELVMEGDREEDRDGEGQNLLQKESQVWRWVPVNPALSKLEVSTGLSQILKKREKGTEGVPQLVHTQGPWPDPQHCRNWLLRR